MDSLPSRRSVLSIASGAIVAGLAGCLTGSDESGDDSHRDDEETHQGEESASASGSGAEVIMVTGDSGTHFEPHVVQIEPGDSVTWTLDSGSHTTTAYAPANDKPRRIPDDAEAWDSGTISEEDATFEHTFETEGVYDYYCAPHEDAGMLGSVVVGDSHLDDQPGMTEPQSELPDGAQEKIQELNEMVRSGGEGGHSDDEDSH